MFGRKKCPICNSRLKNKDAIMFEAVMFDDKPIHIHCIEVARVMVKLMLHPQEEETNGRQAQESQTQGDQG